MPACAELNLPSDRTRRGGGISATFLNHFEVQRIVTPKDQRIIGILPTKACVSIRRIATIQRKFLVSSKCPY